MFGRSNRRIVERPAFAIEGSSVAAVMDNPYWIVRSIYGYQWMLYAFGHALYMNFPYALLHCESKSAKQRIAQVFLARLDVGSDCLSPPITKGFPAMNDQKEGAKQTRHSQKLRCSRDVSRDRTRDTAAKEQTGSNTRDMSASSFTLTVLLLRICIG